MKLSTIINNHIKECNSVNELIKLEVLKSKCVIDYHRMNQYEIDVFIKNLLSDFDIRKRGYISVSSNIYEKIITYVINNESNLEVRDVINRGLFNKDIPISFKDSIYSLNQDMSHILSLDSTSHILDVLTENKSQLSKVSKVNLTTFIEHFSLSIKNETMIDEFISLITPSLFIKFLNLEDFNENQQRISLLCARSSKSILDYLVKQDLPNDFKQQLMTIAI